MLAAIGAARADGAAVLIAAHRTSVLKVVDRAYMIEDGQLRPLRLAEAPARPPLPPVAAPAMAEEPA
jgi:ABC-type lipoprotein export system ATPase subunit